LIIGGPAKVARDLTSEQIEALRQSAHHYVENGARFRNGLKRIG
jgi:carbonic anhydrase/acetyltransferase-like protein (isoleucine patch superfamily)